VHHDLASYDAHRKKYPKKFRVLLLNPEAVTPIRDKLKRRKWDWFIWDEAQRLKNRTSQSSRDASMIAQAANRRLALTGTPMDLDPKDLWAIMRFIDRSVLGDKWKDFEAKFLQEPTIDLTKKMGMIQRKKLMLAYQIAKRKAPMREDMIDEYAKLISPHVMRISKEDAGIDPARVKVVELKLDPQEERRYRKLERTMVVKHGGKTIKTPLKITQIGKLQQLTGGYIKDEDGEVHWVGTTKRRKLKRLIRRKAKGQPFVVFCKYVWEVHMIARVLERMGLGQGAKLWGKVKDIKTDPRRTNMLLAFQEGKYPWMVCQQRTGGVGVDLYYARKFFVYSMGHSYIDYDQMLSRGDFLDQDSRADFFLLAVQSSIDTDIIASVKRKKSITEQFYDRLNSNHPPTKGHLPMAKKDKKEKAPEKEAAPEFKYGVEDIADELGIKPASVRVQLRNNDIEKAGKSYGWNSKKELAEVIDTIRSDKDDEDEDEAPKKKKKKKKSKKSDD